MDPIRRAGKLGILQLRPMQGEDGIPEAGDYQEWEGERSRPTLIVITCELETPIKMDAL